MPGLKERAKTLVELLDSAGFLFAERPIALDGQGREAARRWRAGHACARSCRGWKGSSPGRQPALEEAVRGFAEETGHKLGKVAQPLRAALTGRSASPGIFDVLAVLGREEALARIRDQVHSGKSA